MMAGKPRVTSKPRAPKLGAPCAGVPGGCEIQDLFRLLGKPHTLDILHLFLVEASGPRRFVDVQTRLKLSPNTLSERLRELVEAGLLTRTAYNEIPPRVDYDATAKARELKAIFTTLLEWTRKHDLKPIEAAAPEPAKA